MRVQDVTIKTFMQPTENQEKVDTILSEKYNLKSCLQADLTRSFVHRDVLKLIRASLPDSTEHQVLTSYLKWIIELQGQYKTTLAEDKVLVKEIQGMHQFVTIYRIG